MSDNVIRPLFIVPDLRIGGAERHLVTLVTRMDATRFRPEVLCIGEEGEFFSALTDAGIPAHAMRLPKRHALQALRGLVETMRRMRPDVVVLRGYNAEALGRIAARIAGVKHAVLWVHNIGDAEPRGRARRLTDRILDRWTDRYFGVAEAQRSYLTDDLGYPADRVRIIHNGVDPAQFGTGTDRRVLTGLGIAPGAPVAGVVAALRPEKDHVTFLHAARRVVDARPGAQFLVIGDGPARPGLETLCATLGLADNVHFTGARRDIDRLLQAVDVFVLSSRTVECFPVSLLEAMACARPAVCTDVGGVAEMLVDGVTGHLVPPGDPGQLAGRLEQLFADPAAARRMGLAGRARVEAMFSLDRSVAAAEDAIEEVCATSAHAQMEVGR
ncbi:glycosyltransferase [Mycolicibacterium arseniciresistens]|uniref:Glycosyltransferase n=1 Tax=Mycolicibacterium arseniciresistens TaxID=3062257 RepID=A0ABT8UGC6_9MYCO|nr:glycosyltransferase [Mycolicibacterium arseniciresistens]MDO3636847.1 glycosyltransferase [Mycolicibacterium arseniciresistens]